MKLIKKDIGIKICGKRKTKYRVSLFLCPVCGKAVERINGLGKRSTACSMRCAAKAGQVDKRPANICGDCAVDNCDWLLKGKAIRGWTAERIPYKPNEPNRKFRKTYYITKCPKFKKA